MLDGETAGYVAFVEGADSAAITKLAKLRDAQAKQSKLDEDKLVNEAIEFTESDDASRAQTLGPDATEVGTLTAPREFKLMFETKVGPLADDSATAYLRPETAQGIFANYKNVVDTGRVKILFGIAQIGKAFRNEITPRNFIFRSREFEQMEIEYFIAPMPTGNSSTASGSTSACWLVSIGLRAKPSPKTSTQRTSSPSTLRRPPTSVPLPTRRARALGHRLPIRLRPQPAPTALRQVHGDLRRIFEEQIRPHVIEPSLGVDRTYSQSSPLPTPKTKSPTTKVRPKNAPC